MKRAIRAAGATIALTGMTAQALAGEECGNGDGRFALRVAALQQELMVAALTCQDVERYNAFVLSYRPELLAFDDALKAYFIRNSGSIEAYHAFKTRLANQASIRRIDDVHYCYRADAAFAAAKQARSLVHAVAQMPAMIEGTYAGCSETDVQGASRRDSSPSQQAAAAEPADSQANDGFVVPRRHTLVSDAR